MKPKSPEKEVPPADRGSIRLFVAVPLPPPVKQFLKRYAAEVQKMADFRRWAHPEDTHITVQFLGSVAPSLLAPLKERLAAVAAAAEPLRLELTEPGTFGRPDAPRILWAGVAGDLAALERLQRAVTDALEPLGFEAEKRAYRPHITLAKQFRGGSPAAAEAAWAVAGTAERADAGANEVEPVGADAGASAAAWAGAATGAGEEARASTPAEAEPDAEGGRLPDAGPGAEAGVTAWTVSELVLYESRLGSSPMYHPEAVFPIGRRP